MLQEDLKNWHSRLHKAIENGLNDFKSKTFKNRIKLKFSISPEDEHELKEFIVEWRNKKDSQRFKDEGKRIEKEFEKTNPIPHAKDYS